jgi:hypothetical protein
MTEIAVHEVTLDHDPDRVAGLIAEIAGLEPGHARA